nr:unnamed protein product [Callosobruchus analis]
MLKGHLPQHMRMHKQDKPHGCAHCGSRFAQRSQLTVHQRIHSGEKPYRCEVCWKAFAHSTALKLHTRKHTGEKPFKCVLCVASFTQLPHLKKHMLCVHKSTKPYVCSYCKSFHQTKMELEAHYAECKDYKEPKVPDIEVTEKVLEPPMPLTVNAHRQQALHLCMRFFLHLIRQFETPHEQALGYKELRVRRLWKVVFQMGRFEETRISTTGRSRRSFARYAIRC